MNYVIKSISETYTCIGQHKLFFMLLIFTQLILIVLSTSLFLYTQLNIVQEINIINEKLIILTEQKTSSDQQQILQDTGAINSAFTSIKKYFFTFLAGVIFIYSTLHSSIWIMSHKMIKKERLKGELGKMWLQFITISLVIFLLIYGISYFFIKNAIFNKISVNSFYTMLNILIYSAIPIYCFLLISYAFLGESWIMLKKKMVNSIKKWSYILIPLGINTIILSVSAYLFYISTHKELFFLFMALSSIFITIVLVITRLFWIIALNNIKIDQPHEKNNY